MLKAIRTYFFEREKKKRLHAVGTIPTAFKRDRKNHYGLLIDASNPEDRTAVTSFAEELRRTGNRCKNPWLCKSGKWKVYQRHLTYITDC
jgi:hypothetical protein